MIFSLFLFLIIRTQQVREFSKTAKINIVTQEKVVVVGSSERVVDVTVKLPESLFSRQPAEEELIGEVDLRNEVGGKIRMRLSRDNFPLLDKRYTLTVHDPWLEIELDSVVQKTVPVRAVLQGLPKDGLEIEKVVVSPEVIELKGGKKELQRLENISTSPINIENIDKNFSALARLIIEEGSSIRVNEDKVNVLVVIGKRQSIRLFRSIPVNVVGIKGIVTQPQTVDVELQGEEKYLQEISPSEVSVFVDGIDMVGQRLSERLPEERKLRLKIPANTSLVRVLPESVFMVKEN